MASLLDALKNEDMSRIMEICEKVTFAAGQRIFAQGDIAWDMYIIRKGKIKLMAEIEDLGKVKIGQENPGAFLGEVAMIEDVSREFTAVAMEEVEALKITKRDLDGLQRISLSLATRFYLAIIREMNRKLKKFNTYYLEIKSRIKP
jgi:CRP-like cAMP-binding protein